MQNPDSILSSLLTEISSINKRVGNLEKEVASLERENKLLKKENKTLKEKLTKYENPNNSSNSSVPPSKDENRPTKTSSLRTYQ